MPDSGSSDDAHQVSCARYPGTERGDDWNTGKLGVLKNMLLALLARPHLSPRGRCWGNSLQKVKWEDTAFGWYYSLVLAAVGHLKHGIAQTDSSSKALILSAALQPGLAGRGKGKDTALDLALISLLGNLGPHKLRLCHAETKSSHSLLRGPGQKLRKASKAVEVGSRVRDAEGKEAVSWETGWFLCSWSSCDPWEAACARLDSPGPTGSSVTLWQWRGPISLGSGAWPHALQEEEKSLCGLSRQ